LVQALGSRYTASFYEELAEIGKTPKLDLHQLGQVVPLLQAITYKQGGKLSEYEALLRAKAKSTIDFSLLNNLELLKGGKSAKRISVTSSRKLEAVHPSRFQILYVDRDTPIKDFVVDNGLTFKTGRGFYEFTKPVEVQEYKEVIIQDKSTGEMFSGNKAREILGIPVGVRAKVKPGYLTKYRGFIQSTSNNRKLIAGTNFLYEVDDFRE
jgi:hypothetical protein